MEYLIGVHQCDNLAPLLSIIVFQAVMESLEEIEEIEEKKKSLHTQFFLTLRKENREEG